MSARLALAALAVAALLAGAGHAHAARFQVHPTRVDLAGDHHVGSVTVTNRSTGTVRFQVTAMAWSEGEDGTTGLVATDDVVVYPSLFSLPAGASRAVRVTTATPPGSREVSYRIFVEELPPPRTGGGGAPGRVTMLTRMAIPVFLPPTRDHVAGAVTAAVSADAIDLRLVNRGSVHVRVKAVRVIAEGAGGVVFDRSQAGWYLLAGGARRYRLPLAAGERARIQRVRVEAITSRATWTTTLAAAGSAR